MYLPDGPEVFTMGDLSPYYRDDHLLIRFEVNGFPIPTVAWFHNGIQLTENSINTTFNNFGIGNSTMRITDLQLSDGGIYVCMANSSEGVASNFTIVTVLCE